MVLTETVAYTSMLAITIIFSCIALALGNKEKIRIVIKVIAGMSWFVLSLTQIYFFGASFLLAVPLMAMFMGIGMVFSFSIVQDFKTEKNRRIFSFDED